MITPPITVAESRLYTRMAEQLLSPGERSEAIDFLARNPQAGDLIPGAGGIRKVRFAAQGKGKSGGVRVIYYYLDDDLPLYALLIYGKGRKTDLSPDEREAVARLAAGIKAAWKARRNRAYPVKTHTYYIWCLHVMAGLDPAIHVAGAQCVVSAAVPADGRGCPEQVRA